MNAWILNGIGELNFNKAAAMPSPMSNEVLIKVKAAGICGSDIPRVYENGAHKMPLVVGHEFSGLVIKTGKNVNKRWVGKRVGVFPLVPCKRCVACMHKKYEMCCQYSYLGSRRDGGFAEYVSVPKWNLIELPENVTYEQAAMLEPMAVAVHAMRRLDLSGNSSVAVCGLGAIGLLLIMFLLEKGIKNVFAIGVKNIQKDKAIEFGLPEENYCDARKQDVIEFLKQKTGNRGVDAYYECVGKNDSITQSIDATASGGQICMVGNPYSDLLIKKELYWEILRKQLTITGTWNSSYLGASDENSPSDDWNYVLRRLEKGTIYSEKIITHRLPLRELNSGLEIIRNKLEEYIKVMCIMEDSVHLLPSSGNDNVLPFH